MRFLADMGISPITVQFLVSLGYDAFRLSEQGLHRMPDPDILQMARDEGRILFTHDLDFGDILAASGDRSPSVIIFRLHSMRPDAVNMYLTRVIYEFEDSLDDGAIISVTEGQIRCRQLPIQ